jgi:hypothetical protein
MDIAPDGRISRQTRWAAATNTALSALTVIVVAFASGLAIGIVSLRFLVRVEPTGGGFEVIPVEPTYDPALPLDRAPHVTAGDGPLNRTGVL